MIVGTPFVTMTQGLSKLSFRMNLSAFAFCLSKAETKKVTFYGF
jgi:hypothetical protein